MTRSDIVLTAMEPAPRDVWIDPVRIQKLLFLIDMEAPTLVGGPHFDFQPYSYGPVDLDVYIELEALTADSNVHTDRTLRHLRFRPTSKGISTRRRRQSAIAAVLTGLAGSIDIGGLLDERPAGTDGNVAAGEAIGDAWRRTGDHLRAVIGEVDGVRGRK